MTKSLRQYQPCLESRPATSIGTDEAPNLLGFIDAERHVSPSRRCGACSGSQEAATTLGGPSRHRRGAARTPPSPPRFARSIEVAGRPTALRGYARSWVRPGLAGAVDGWRGSCGKPGCGAACAPEGMGPPAGAWGRRQGVAFAAVGCSEEGGQARLDVIGHVALPAQALEEGFVVGDRQGVRFQWT